MRVYILKADDTEHQYVEGVFASFSAMLTWLKVTYNYISETGHRSDAESGWFIDKSKLDGLGRIDYKLFYTTYDVIGEHSVTTDKIEFN